MSRRTRCLFRRDRTQDRSDAGSGYSVTHNRTADLGVNIRNVSKRHMLMTETGTNWGLGSRSTMQS